jgi:F0F1-type ATP synthase assembly protein I
MPEGPMDPKEVGRLYALAQVGMEMVVPIVIGLGLDRWLGWTPWGVVAGAVLGFAGGMIHMVALLNQGNDSSSKQRRDRK